jgi:hypothetical protein
VKKRCSADGHLAVPAREREASRSREGLQRRKGLHRSVSLPTGRSHSLDRGASLSRAGMRFTHSGGDRWNISAVT